MSTIKAQKPKQLPPLPAPCEPWDMTHPVVIQMNQYYQQNTKILYINEPNQDQNSREKEVPKYFDFPMNQIRALDARFAFDLNRLQFQKLPFPESSFSDEKMQNFSIGLNKANIPMNSQIYDKVGKLCKLFLEFNIEKTQMKNLRLKDDSVVEPLQNLLYEQLMTLAKMSCQNAKVRTNSFLRNQSSSRNTKLFKLNDPKNFESVLKDEKILFSSLVRKCDKRFDPDKMMSTIDEPPKFLLAYNYRANVQRRLSTYDLENLSDAINCCNEQQTEGNKLPSSDKKNDFKVSFSDVKLCFEMNLESNQNNIFHPFPISATLNKSFDLQITSANPNTKPQNMQAMQNMQNRQNKPPQMMQQPPPRY